MLFLGIPYQDLHFQFSERNDITVIKYLLHVGSEALPVDICSVGGAKIHKYDTVSITLDHAMQTRHTRSVGLIRR